MHPPPHTHTHTHAHTLTNVNSPRKGEPAGTVVIKKELIGVLIIIITMDIWCT